MEYLFGCLSKFISCTFGFLLILFSCTAFTSTEASGVHDLKGNITVKWDLLVWTPDGYVAIVDIYNYQNTLIRAPGWTLGWTWAKKEVIWNMVGAHATLQGNCARFKTNIPQSCKKDPIIVDLLPGTPLNQQVANCCRGGVIKSNSLSSFQISVGHGGTSNRTVKLPAKFIFKAPGNGYNCGPAKVVKPTRFITPDGRRVTQALMTWNVICKVF